MNFFSNKKFKKYFIVDNCVYILYYIAYIKFKSKPVLLKNVGRDKYNRLLADVYCGEKDAAGILLKEKLALPYSGRTKRPDWCEHLKSKKSFFFNF